MSRRITGAPVPATDAAHRPLLAVSTTAILLLLAGCGAPRPDTDPAPESGGSDWLADCGLEASWTSAADDVCLSVLAPSPSDHREAHLAVDPGNPSRVLVTWAEVTGTRAIWAAYSTDAGRSWASARLHDPSLDDPNPLAQPRYAFDSIAGFLPNGRMVVFYGGEYVQPVGSFIRLTVALSDTGDQWAYHRFGEGPFSDSWDFMDLAISPDTGTMHAVAQSVVRPGLQYWRSTDGGHSWSGPDPEFASATADMKTPRISAESDGIVVMVGTQLPSGASVVVSADDGETFSDPVRTGVPGGTGDPIALWSQPNGLVRIDVIRGIADGLVAARSINGGESFASPVLLRPYPPGVAPIWAVATTDPGGTVFILDTYGTREPPRWGARLLVWQAASEQVEERVLAQIVEQLPPQDTAGDDYGAIHLAADGSLWAAWSDPRVRDADAIGIVHLLPPTGSS
jgi:hypothetical protein